MSEKRKPKKGVKPVTRVATSSSPMDVNLLEQIVQLMASHDLNTVDVRDGDRRVILKRGAVAYAAAAPVAAAPVAQPQVVAASSVPAAKAAVPAADDEAGYHKIKSPMVGTFYAASKPGEKPFVSVGSRVSNDTDVCIIEAMKTFNNVQAECTGTIARILVQDGQPVEFGTVLFTVKP